MRRCYRCGAHWTEVRRPGFRETCDQCQSYWCCCRNCRLYDEGQPNRCRSRTTEPVRDPEMANVCGEFVLRMSDADEGEADRRDPKGKWNKLFGC